MLYCDSSIATCALHPSRLVSLDVANSVGFLEWWLLSPPREVLWKFVGYFLVVTMSVMGISLQRDARSPAMHGPVSQEKVLPVFETCYFNRCFC